MNSYQIELNRWGIQKDGTNPVETLNGLNNALVWASSNGYNECILEDGLYMIDKNNHIKMVSDMVFTLSQNAIIQKESNSFEGYKIMDIGIETQNVTIRGGTYRGDKDTHGFVGKGTHEGGYGIVTSGARNVLIENVKATHFTGDGLAIGTKVDLLKEYYAKDFLNGNVNEKGEVVTDNNSVILKGIPLTHENFKYQRTFQFLHVKDFPNEASGYIAFFYKSDGSYIGKINTVELNTPVGWGLNEIPQDAVSMNVVFPVLKMPDTVYIELWSQSVSRNVTVRNSEFAFNRRQGITIGGGLDIVVTNCIIHDMQGTAPQSGIDVEAGYNLNKNITITNNSFYNNQAYDLILYDGRNAIVKGNQFKSKSIGLAISEPFKYAEITDNTFENARIYAYNYATFKNNKMKNALAAFLGENVVIDGFQFENTLINLAASKPFGIEATNITCVNNDQTLFTQLGINSNPIKLTNVTITGQNALDSFGGNASDGSIFENIVIKDYKRIQIPRGTYRKCVFETKISAGPEINNTGTYSFDGCKIKSLGTSFEVNSVHGVPDKVVVKDCKLETTKDGVLGISIQSGKDVSFEENTIKTGKINSSWVGAVKVNNYWEKDKPCDVINFTMRKNKITTGGMDIGISTIHAGTNSNPFVIEKNTLTNCKLELKANDLNKDNVLK